MCLTIFFSLSTLFCLNFIQGILNERDAAFVYRKLVVDKKDNDNEFTDFCLNTNQKTLAYVCDRAFEQLRKKHPYNDVYFYPTATSKKSQRECVEGSVVLNETSSVIQNMKDCPAGPAVIPQAVEERNFQIYNKIMVFAKSLHSIFIFKKVNESTNYNASVLDWFIEPDYSFNVESKPSPIFAKNRLISPTLFIISPPNSLSYETLANGLGYKKYIPVTKLNKRNIVNKSDERKFAKLCMMALRRAKYPDVIVDVISLIQEKPKTIDVEVKIEGLSIKTIAQPCYIYKFVAHFTINELKQIFSPEEVEKLTNMNEKDERLGYELSPVNIKEALNLDFDMLREKMDKIEYMLTVTSNPTTYFLSQVSDENSIAIIRKMDADEGSMKYEFLEAIINIRDEYLERIDLDNEKEYLIRLHELQEGERLILEHRKNAIWHPKDSATNSNKENYYDRLFEKLHKQYEIHRKNRISIKVNNEFIV